MLTGDNPTNFTVTVPAVTESLNRDPSQPQQLADQHDWEQEVDRLSEALAIKFEELTLIHQLSERLKLGEDADQICQSLLQELTTCIEARSIAIDLYPDIEAQNEERIYVVGRHIDVQWLRTIADHTTEAAPRFSDSSGDEHVAIVNAHDCSEHSAIRSVVVPIQRDNTKLGRMIAIRGTDEPEFGTVEVGLMKSTSMMLAAHLMNQRQYREMQLMFEGTIQSLVSALDAKDAYTCGHSNRVAELAVELAQRLGFSDEGITRIRMAGILHDIGKIGVEDSVLRKPGRLTDEEFEQIKQHPVLGFEILQGIRPFRKILPAVRHHHESWDGSGYPDGLVGEKIPRYAQVLAVADSFDAMVSDRPYRPGMPLEKVIGIFKQGRGSQWATDVVDALLANPDVMQAYADRQSSATKAE